VRFSLFEFYYVALGFVLIIGFIVWWDAKEQEDENAALWGLGTAMILIVVLPLYLYHRAYGREKVHWIPSRTQEISFHGQEEARSTVKCPRCWQPTIERVNAYYCEKCDRFVDKQRTVAVESSR
jgi:4-amino-4-deoxy-L-arabinose transferase-like glycosyltransferase